MSALPTPKVKARVDIDGTLIETVLSLTLTQPYGAHHTMTLRCFARELQAPAIPTIEEQTAALLGRLTEVELYNVNDTDTGAAPTGADTGTGAVLQAKFVISALAFEQSAMGEAVLCLTGHSPTWLLDGAPSYESFTGKSPEDIATLCARGMERVRTRIRTSPTLTTPLPYVCRWGESRWNFLKRMAAGSGQWLYFNGRDLIFGLPQKTAPVPLIYGHNCYQVSMRMATGGGAPSIVAYDAAANSLLKGDGSGSEDGSLRGSSYGGVGQRKSRDLFGGMPGAGGAAAVPSVPQPFFPALKELVDAGAAAGAGAEGAGYYRMQGESTAWQLTVGSLLDVRFAQGRGREAYAHTGMRVTGVVHSLDVTGAYSNTFEAMSDKAPYPPVPEYEPPRTHAVLGEVLDNGDPLGMGRVQVRMPGWSQDHSEQRTDWIRVLSGDAGGTGRVAQNRGIVFVPEVGDQCLIDFLEGNPDKPYVAGALYHGGNAGGQSNMIRTIMTKSGNKIILDDNEGSVTVADASGNNVLLDGKGSIYINASSNDVTVSAPETMTLNSRNMNINVREDLRLFVGQNQLVHIGKQHTVQSESVVHTVENDHTQRVGGNLPDDYRRGRHPNQ